MKSVLTTLLVLLTVSAVGARGILPSVEIYPDYTYNMSEDKKYFNSFNIKMAYFGVKGSFMKQNEEGSR